MLTKRSIATVILLSIVTCGIYSLYWSWVTIHELDAAGNSSNMEPLVQFILLFFYVGYILFGINADANINAVRQKNGLPVKDNKVLWLILGLFLPIVLVILVQSEINELA